MKWIAAATALTVLGALPAAGAEPVTIANGTATYALHLGAGLAPPGLTSVSGSMVSTLTQPDCGTYRIATDMVMRLAAENGMTVEQKVTGDYTETPDTLTFKTSSALMGATLESAAGVATRDADGVRVTPDDPDTPPFHLDGPVAFPFQMTRALVEAAADGRRFVTFLAFDGSGTGREERTVSAVIGELSSAPVAGAEGEIINAVGWQDLRRWPVTLTYFGTGAGDSQPAMSITMTLIENGFAVGTTFALGALTLDLEMVGLQPIDPPSCL